MALELAVVCHAFGLGGTGKAAVQFAREHDRARVRPRAISLLYPDVRDDELRAAGIEVQCAHGDLDRAVALLEGADVVHVHRPGSPEPLVPAAFERAGISTIVETNVFGLNDPRPEERLFSMHLFVSATCAMRARRASGIDAEEFFRRNAVLANPVDIDGLRAAAPTKADARVALGLSADRPTVVRVARADDRKWADILTAMVPHLTRLVPDVQILFVGSTPHRRAQLRHHGVLDSVTCLDPALDVEQLARYYAAGDVFVSASSIGESFGISIAEAMALGLPVVTSSTPWTDNAQIELVENGRSGWVANHPRAFAEATADLLRDAARRDAFGQAGAERADAEWHPSLLTRRLELLFESLVATGRAPAGWWTPSVSELCTFEAQHEARASRQFRELTTRERREAAAAIVRERTWWALHDLRTSPAREGTRLGTMAVHAAARSVRATFGHR